MTSGLPEQQALRFDGPEYIPARDKARLGRQIQDIYEMMQDGRWRTLREISRALTYPEASVSAQLRHLRKERFGGHTVERRHCGYGLFEYRLIVKQ